VTSKAEVERILLTEERYKGTDHIKILRQNLD
jgi:hypothetical protein